MVNAIKVLKVVPSCATVLALVTSVASAAVSNVHVDSLPTDITGFDKSTSAFMYLEGESATDAAALSPAPVFADSQDASHTFYRSAVNPDTYWGTITPTDNGVYANRGANTNQTDRNIYWDDVPAGLSAGTYEVYIRTSLFSGATSSEAFTLYAGTDRATASSSASMGSVTVTTVGQGWYKLATVDLTPSIDSFRLKIDTVAAPPRLDTMLFVMVPEPSVVALLGLGLGALLWRKND